MPHTSPDPAEFDAFLAQHPGLAIVDAVFIDLNGIMRGSGDTRTPLVIAGIMNIWNIVLAALLVFGPGPIPALGVASAGIATASARVPVKRSN